MGTSIWSRKVSRVQPLSINLTVNGASVHGKTLRDWQLSTVKHVMHSLAGRAAAWGIPPHQNTDIMDNIGHAMMRTRNEWTTFLLRAFLHAKLMLGKDPFHAWLLKMRSKELTSNCDPWSRMRCDTGRALSKPNRCSAPSRCYMPVILPKETSV